MSRSVAACLTPPPSPGREPETRKEPIRLPYKSIVTVEDCTDDEDDDNFRGYRAPSVEAVHDQDLPKKQAKPAAKQPAARAPSVSFAPTLLQRRRSASPETSRSSSPKRVHFSPRPHSVRRRSDKPPPVLMSIKTGQQASAPRVPTPFPWDNSRRLDSLLYQLSSYIVDAYEPRTSIDAIPPVKMAKFFQDFPIVGRDHVVVPGPPSPSVFPFKRAGRHVDLHTIFLREPGTAHYSALSAFYAALNCEVVMMPKERGNNRLGQQMVPSLTPTGFVSFMRLMIRAFPEREARRWSLIDAILDRDGRRLYTKELFPTRKHEPSRHQLEDAVDEWASVSQSVQKREERGRGSSRDEGRRRRDERDSRPRRK